MQLLLTIAVLAAVVGEQLAEATPVSQGTWRAALAVAGMVLIAAVAWLISRRFITLWQREILTRAEWLGRLDRAQRWHAVLWLAVVVLTMFVLGWPQLVRDNWQLDCWPLIDDVCLLVPAILPLLCSWAAFYQIELAIHADRQLNDPTNSQRCESLAHYLWSQSRQQLATLLIPTFVLLGIEDLLRSTAPQWLDDQHAWLWAIPALGLLLAGFPVLLKHVWQTTELPAGPLREQLQNALASQGQSVRNIYLWQTGGRTINAAVAGWLPRWRFIFLSDRLLEQFSEAQVSAVVAHELGHVRGRHMLLRTLAMIVPAVFLLAIGELLPAESDASAREMITSQSSVSRVAALSFASADLFFPLGMVLFASTVLGRYSRLLELEADYLACCPVSGTARPAELVGQMSAEQTELFLSTLARLAATAETPADQATWLHPSLTTRASFLLTLLHSPAARMRFSRYLSGIRTLLIAALGIGVAFYMLVA